MEPQINRIWKPIEFQEAWLKCDTSVLDGVTDAWYARREELQSSSNAFSDFMNQLKREHAIETGVIERLYDLDRGVTETLIRKGFIDTQVTHLQTDVAVPKLFGHLKDHMDAIDFVFDMVNENRPLSIGFIHELHQLVTRNQTTTEARDQFGNKTEVELLKGRFKTTENNPTRPDGSKVYYCPPINVQDEVENLVTLYNEATENKVHPVVIAAWFHHAFSTIHPYQDGNGRVDRLLSSLILIKHGLFPFTVRREEAKDLYIDALEKADSGNPQPLVSYFCETQREHIEKALNLREATTASSLDEVARLFSGKLEEWQSKTRKEHEAKVALIRNEVFELCLTEVNSAVESLREKINGGAELEVKSCSPKDGLEQHFYYGQIIKYAKRHGYYFNRHLPKGWIMVTISLNHVKWYRLGMTVHHQGSDDGTLVLGAFLEDTTTKVDHNERIDATLPLEIRPVLISTIGEASSKGSIISKFVEHALTLTLGHIASEL
ncbi:MAG TPA: Fic family protein [Flavobacteriales bacterium]|nr:Fic family protein [Flavobacteriales bacterium]MBK7481535.1 Fic family protein [Flavobacteriales bacterium]MBK7620294.1 Fic family protein [Flavobacteriales bacterium]MBK8530408.1 Fic family protein [Flavobacteriales bacterium]MBK8707617.1 Fic family protein [Flavobacteriales bacterium]